MDVPRGAIYGFLGPNGSGKTRLMRAIAGLLTFDEGSLHWAGQPVSRDRQYFRQQFTWLGHRTGLKHDLTPVGGDALTLPAPKAVIASMLNMSSETFSRELHRLKDRGLIEINRRTIYLRDREGLLAIAHGLNLEAATA